jgi:hypothetical protein
MSLMSEKSPMAISTSRCLKTAARSSFERTQARMLAHLEQLADRGTRGTPGRTADQNACFTHDFAPLSVESIFAYISDIKAYALKSRGLFAKKGDATPGGRPVTGLQGHRLFADERRRSARRHYG